MLVFLEKKPRKLCEAELKLLADFAHCEVSLDELLQGLDGVLEIDFAPAVRRLYSQFIVPEPGVRIEHADIDRAIARRESGAMSAKELMDWATMIRLNDAYEWEETEEGGISDRLEDLSMAGFFNPPPNVTSPD